MTIKRPILALILCCLLFALVGWTAGRATAPAPVSWEYKESCSPKDMDKLGAEGWELVAAAQNGVVVCLFYKRQK
jgi:membrane protease YdiL (CAAX protease family)